MGIFFLNLSGVFTSSESSPGNVIAMSSGSSLLGDFKFITLGLHYKLEVHSLKGVFIRQRGSDKRCSQVALWEMQDPAFWE